MNNDIYDKVAKSLNIPLHIVKEVYKLYWLTIRKNLEELPLKTNISEEEFDKLLTSINIPSLGKLFASYQRYKNINTKRKLLQDAEIKKSKTSAQ